LTHRIFLSLEEAINDYLLREQYGDAPFMVQQTENEKRQISQETPVKIDKNPEKVEKEETISAKTPSFDGIIKELGIKKTEVTPIPSEEAEDKLIEILSTHQDGETKPRKRRL
jgi:hypothetical protein